MKTVLITGITGFVGREVYRTLSKDHKIIAFSRQVLPDLDIKCQVNGNMEDEGVLKGSRKNNFTFWHLIFRPFSADF